MPIAFDATANAQRKNFDKGINELVLSLPSATRDAETLDMDATAVRGVGPGGYALLVAATGDSDVTIRKFNAFMDRPNAGDELAHQVKGAGGNVLVGGNVPGILIRAWQRLG